MEFIISLSHVSSVSYNNNNNVYFCTSICVVLLGLFLSLIRRRWRISKRRQLTVPEASGSWPLLGHLPLLSGWSVPPQVALSELADRCGSLFTVKLGVHRAIVVNTWEIAKDLLTTHDLTFATRPMTMNFEVLGYNCAMFIFSPYGPYWRQIRKIVTLELLSSHRLELMKHVRESEVDAFIKDAYASWRKSSSSSAVVLVDMTRWFWDNMLNITLLMIIGKRFHDGDQVDEKERQSLQKFMELMGQFVVSDAFPSLRWLDLGGYGRAMQRTSKELDAMLQRWLDGHKSAKKKLSGEQDFMDIILSTTLNEEVQDIYDVDTINKATCLVLVIGASQTTTITLLWALSLLLNHKESLKKIQQELDANVGRERHVKESDLKNLPYFQAVMKETLRLYPPGPLIPREAIEDCTFQGYFVPKGTRLLLNLYKIQRDSRVWQDPDEFMPERFLSTHKDFDVKGHNFEILPFGSGRRMCPGISLALSVMGLSLASFLHAFEVRSPRDELVDMAETNGFTTLKASPLEVIIKPRLPEFMYQ